MAKTLIIFAKAPFPGKVKTRLQPDLPPSFSSRLQEAFVRDAIALAGDIKGVRLFLACSPDVEDPLFQDIARRERVELMVQQGADLGERMEAAIRSRMAGGDRRVVIIGTDSPTLPRQYLEEAFDRLEKTELVLGPSCDGGYYLVGVSVLLPELFRGIPWGTGDVLWMTLQRVRERGIRVSLLPFWYDVDTLTDLRFLVHHLHLLSLNGERVPRHTTQLLESHTDTFPQEQR